MDKHGTPYLSQSVIELPWAEVNETDPGQAEFLEN
jgi:hypothetical protein